MDNCLHNRLPVHSGLQTTPLSLSCSHPLEDLSEFALFLATYSCVSPQTLPERVALTAQSVLSTNLSLAYISPLLELVPIPELHALALTRLGPSTARRDEHYQIQRQRRDS